jgi:hypothetical protein
VQIHICRLAGADSLLRTAGEAVFLEQLGRRRPDLAGDQTDESLEHLLECPLPDRVVKSCPLFGGQKRMNIGKKLGL